MYNGHKHASPGYEYFAKTREVCTKIFGPSDALWHPTNTQDASKRWLHYKDFAVSKQACFETQNNSQ